MASSDTELEQQLLEAGNKLVEPSSSVDELLPLLDQVENCLSRVEQSPTKSMQNALSPSIKALVAHQLFRHPNADVKVAVASCISEITRITAPEAPYDDDQMKDVFQLIVSSFENLFDKSSRSYDKRTSILETVAKVRSCVVMLDLECDSLIIEMFQYFLKAIRDYHPENVFSSMETIMTLVLEESEDISLDLLSPILASIKKDNKDVLPVARKLGERVLEACAIKLKPYLIEAIKSSGISLDDYSEVFASICQETSGTVEQNDIDATNERMVDESNSVRTSFDEAAQEDKGDVTEAASPEKVDHANDRSPKSAVSNGIAETGEDDSSADLNSLKNQEPANDQSKSIDAPSGVEPDSLGSEKVVVTELKPDQTTKKRGKKPNFLIKFTEPSDSSYIDGEKELEKLRDHKIDSKDVPSSPHEVPSVDVAVSSANEKDTSNKPSSPEAVEGESADVALPSPITLPDENRAKKSGGRSKEKESLNTEASLSVDDGSRKASEETSDSEAKPQKSSRKKAPSGTSKEYKSSIVADASKKESDATSYSETKPFKKSAKKVDASCNNGDGLPSKKKEDKKRRRTKSFSEKDEMKISPKDDDKEMICALKSTSRSTEDVHHSEETPKTTPKRKRTPGKEKASDTKDYDENLVGSKIKVWWPKDQTYYAGVVDSYDYAKKKHRVLYLDGDEEILNLKRQRWEFLGGDSGSKATGQPSPDVSSEMPLKKKFKTNSESSTKQGKMDISPKKGGGASSSKSKGSATKSVRKLDDDSKVDGKSKDSSKAVNKSKTDNVGKSKDHTAKSGGKSADVGSKAASKSKSDDAETPKSSKSKEGESVTMKFSTKSKKEASKSGKSKHETPKRSSDAKGKPTKSSGKSNTNGSGILKFGSSKAKESEDLKETSADSTKAPESAKGKSPISSKAQGSEANSGKKRPRVSKKLIVGSD
ncbi:hypothetical protein CFOL_v3_03481 [Cephalotus follicularis]|uniref:Tudor domain-containing protein n=1 Tax=Cephalotus follicularis TaxID=3775 RepID=A0A1Q3AW84_CEPFO|nr:hypothetical protein CFOL_v3_03481 [Cephalotus follicularis]